MNYNFPKIGITVQYSIALFLISLSGILCLVLACRSMSLNRPPWIWLISTGILAISGFLCLPGVVEEERQKYALIKEKVTKEGMDAFDAKIPANSNPYLTKQTIHLAKWWLDGWAEGKDKKETR